MINFVVLQLRNKLSYLFFELKILVMWIVGNLFKNFMNKLNLYLKLIGLKMIRLLVEVMIEVCLFIKEVEMFGKKC
jgi:hypothetical protein